MYESDRSEGRGRLDDNQLCGQALNQQLDTSRPLVLWSPCRLQGGSDVPTNLLCSSNATFRFGTSVNILLVLWYAMISRFAMHPLTG